MELRHLGKTTQIASDFIAEGPSGFLRLTAFQENPLVSKCLIHKEFESDVRIRPLIDDY